jgi:hypothetical protein
MLFEDNFENRFLKFVFEDVRDTFYFFHGEISSSCVEKYIRFKKGELNFVFIPGDLFEINFLLYLIPLICPSWAILFTFLILF